PPWYAAEQRSPSQHVGARPVQRKPLAEELRGGVDASRIRAILFGVGLRDSPVEHEVGAVVNESGAELHRGAGERANTEGVDVQRVDRMILGAVDVSERG